MLTLAQCRQRFLEALGQRHNAGECEEGCPWCTYAAQFPDKPFHLKVSSDVMPEYAVIDSKPYT